jgi:hypothetical protein
MMLGTGGSLHMLAGGLQVKARVQHPQVKPRKDRQGWPWVFRYWSDEMLADGSLKSVRKYEAVGPSKGDGAITKKEAEVERDRFLVKRNQQYRGIQRWGGDFSAFTQYNRFEQYCRGKCSVRTEYGGRVQQRVRL